MNIKLKILAIVVVLMVAAVGYIAIKYADQESYAFSSNEFGFSVTFETEYKVANNEVMFGPVEPVPETPGVEGYSYSITVIPQRPAEDIVQFVKADNLPEDQDSEVLSVNNLTAVTYQTEGLCHYNIVEVVGIKNNYRISHFCGGDLDYMLDVVKTMSVY